MAARALLFDLDGTVWDSFPWYSAVLASHGGQADAEVKLRAGESVLSVARGCGLSRDRFLRACAATPLKLRLFPGVNETLDALRKRAVPVGAVTSLPAHLAASALRNTGLDGRFAAVVDASHGRPYKPHPRPLLVALEQMRLAAGHDIYYVGDVPGDGKAAHAAGLSFAWAAYGYSVGAPPPAEAIIESFPDVLRL